MTDYAKLITDLEAAEGPSRELDARILCLADGWKFEGFGWASGLRYCYVIFFSQSHRFNRMLDDDTKFTGSIDAITGLVESKGFTWSIEARPEKNGGLIGAAVYADDVLSAAMHQDTRLALNIAFVKALEARASR